MNRINQGSIRINGLIWFCKHPRMHAHTRIGAVNICTVNADLVNVPNTMSYTHIHIRRHTRMHTHTNAQMRTRTHAYAKAHTDTRTCTYAFKHTGARGHAREGISSRERLCDEVVLLRLGTCKQERNNIHYKSSVGLEACVSICIRKRD